MTSVNDFNYLFKIKRFEYFNDTTIGELYTPGKQEKFCWTLEDAVRPQGVKIPAETAIPETGLSLAYHLGMRYSPRFKRDMPVIYSEKDGNEFIVKGFGGVTFKYAQIHGGNNDEHTEGCPLVAYNRPSLKTIQGTAEKEVTKLVEQYLKNGRVGISIINMPQRNTKFV
jgi:hypothetical protein